MKRSIAITAILGVVLALAAATAASPQWKERTVDSFATVEQQASSSIKQSADVFAPGPGDVRVDQEAYSNIQQDADVNTRTQPKQTKPQKRTQSQKEDEADVGVCVIGVDSPCNAERWEPPQYTNDRPDRDRVNHQPRHAKKRPQVDRKQRFDQDKDRFDRDKDRKHHKDSAKKQPRRGKQKHTICHGPPGNEKNKRTLTVGSQNAVNAHVGHSDSTSPCKTGNAHKKGW